MASRRLFILGQRPQQLRLARGKQKPGRWLARHKVWPADASQMGGDQYPLTTSGRLAMAGDFATVMTDADAPAGDHHRNRLADQLPRHAIGVGVEFDRRIGLHPPDQLAQLAERGALVEWAEGGRLVTGGELAQAH